MPTFSVVITAYDRHDVTVAHVREAMDVSVKPLEIVVVNDGGSPDLRDMISNLERDVPIIYARIDQDIPWNYTGARNLGVWLSRGDFISQEDNDNIPSFDAYESALNLFIEKPHIGRVTYGKRAKVARGTAVNSRRSEWKSEGSRPRHQDTQMVPRETFLRVKGCDERFAGQYSWACTDWKRRLQRSGIESDSVTTHFWSVWDANTDVCACNSIDRADGVCPYCNKMVWRKSYKNYKMAREKIKQQEYDVLSENEKLNYSRAGDREPPVYAHLQSKHGILNFTYAFETL